jgi:hypothetical protein
MSTSQHARCHGCGRMFRCVLCGNTVEILPFLDNEIFTVDGLAVCLECVLELSAQENEVHPLTRKHGDQILQRVIQELMNS